VAVKLTSLGPILFRQLRIGKRGELFEMLVPTMTDEQASELTIEHHRVTAVGKRCAHERRRALQLFNVLRGNMSLVDPGPSSPTCRGVRVGGPTRTDARRGRYQIPAQVHGRSRDIDSIPERARFDNSYIENRSLWGDILILFRTLEVVFRGDRGDANRS
jgi:lipopolysaccharide/colanic/teichoic acid biosynthesis glycosyltransferase